ncbi:luciferin 4-monooxygenase-like isoform X2 [Epargyreus clarus]|uniref:luciferin 4-monooxygenase-like isoform X2 n=1 Tax=Epargyreus clarus TaxID=520877 RepID=UPI003C2EC196
MMNSANRHLGHLVLDCMQRNPDSICQIDAATGQEESNASVLNRSIRLARCFRKFGLKPGDVLSLAGRNHLDLHIPYYAALLNGLPVSAVDPSFKYSEIKTLFALSRPRVAFCQKETYVDQAKAIKSLGLDTKLLTFDDGENSMQKFIEEYDTDEPIDDFKPSEFDLDKVYALLISTSGTSGKQKLAAIKHNVLINKFNQYIVLFRFDDSGSNKISLNVSPVNWISGLFFAIALPMMKHIKLQTSSDNLDHIINVIKKYKPISTLISTSMMTSFVSRKEHVDLKSFRNVTVTGAKIYRDMITEFRALLHKDAIITEAYGMTETVGPCLGPNPMGPDGTCGKRMPSYQIKLVDPDTGKEVTEANTPGELWVKGEMFSEFYNDSDETKNTFTEDGYYKTGDLLYRDENDNFFYVDRLKSLIKYKNFHVRS